MTNQTETPSTAFVLTMRYQSTTVPLEEIIKHYMPHVGLGRVII